jgi:RNA polymerase sigma-19 factor, ECF subfamily
MQSASPPRGKTPIIHGRHPYRYLSLDRDKSGYWGESKAFRLFVWGAMSSVVREFVNEETGAKDGLELDRCTILRYRTKVMRYLIRRLSRASQDVDDLVQEIYLELLRRDTRKEVRNPLAFIYGVAAHVLADHRTDAAHEHERFVSEEDAGAAWGEFPSDALTDRLEDFVSIQQQIQTALDQLPPMQAAVLVLHKRDGLSYEEVAEKLGLKVDTVHKYLTQARLKIRMKGRE